MINCMCPQCHQNLQIPDEYAGQEGRCPKCGASLVVPEDPSLQGPYDQGGGGQAVASLICAILSFLCLGPLTSLPAVILGHISLSRIKRGQMPANAWGMAIAGLILGYINIVASLVVVLLVFFFALTQVDLGSLQSPAYVATCQNNLKQMGIVFKMYAGENKGFFPQLSAEPGQLMAVKDEIYPEYLTDLNVLLCPVELGRANMPLQVDDESYFYLGYVVTNDREVASFCKAYREHLAQGLAFDEDLPAVDGEGTVGTAFVLRVKEGVERYLVTDIGDPRAVSMTQASIPILIERPENHGAQAGGNVLYMDGHVELVPYPGKWPMTEETITALTELDAMGK